MPKDTFNNLSYEKKQKIFDAAVKEFSTRRFSEASINQIIKTAGIPRGSFYQYFNDKEDIFIYMLEQIYKEKQEIIRNSGVLNPEIDVFDACIEVSRATFKWSKSKPEYTKVTLLMEAEDKEFINNIRLAYSEGLLKMIDRDKERGLIKKEVDSGIIVDMLYALILKEYFWVGLDEEIFFKRMRDVIKVIKEGVAVR